MDSFKYLSFEEKIKKIHRQIDLNLSLMNKEIDDITKRKNKPIRRIENLLDTLLDYMNFGRGENEFKKLNSYYETFNPENAIIYKKFYTEIEDD